MALEGWALAREGRTEQGIEKIGQGIAAYCATEAELWRPLFLGLSAEAHALEGRQAEARQLLKRRCTGRNARESAGLRQSCTGSKVL